MATITARKRKDGSIGYTAQIRIKREGKVVHQESETFDRKPLALAWATKREAELAAPGALDQAINPLTIGDLMKQCVKHLEEIRPIGRGKRSTMLGISNRSTLATLSVHNLTAAAIIEHCRQRTIEGVLPSTINNDLIYIRIAVKMARAMFNLDVNFQAIEDATEQLKSLGWISKSRERTRRPTEDELTRIKDYFRTRHACGRNALPMHEIIDFAIASCRRQEEITKLRWEDLRESDHTAIIADLKHPRQKTGNDRRFRLLQDAWDIIQRQPRTDPRIFPYTPDCISISFSKAVRLLDIKDLRFHDLRHHGVSLIFERGYSIQEVQMISLHDSWTTLQRYTHLQPGDLPER